VNELDGDRIETGEMRALGVSALAFMLAVGSTARAEPVSTSRPVVQWVGLDRPGDTTGSDGHGDPIGELALEPLRLSLLGEHVPLPTSISDCRDGASVAGSFTGGPIMAGHRAFATNLLRPTSWRTPRLTLFGFSRIGCARDSAAGGGLTFTLPVRKDVFFVASGGAIYLPHAGPGGRPVSSTRLGADVVLRRSDGRSYSVGVGTFRGGPMVSVGGIF
jgi:hypothetical protein